ncbi:MAG: helix-turn-helix domain-containing protein [Chloroflexi bacterium]|nr:helix-turn-helix domain-containing protein [Chloroflexota bacterium]
MTTSGIATSHEAAGGVLPAEAANELLDVQDLCDYLKMSRATIQRWCRIGYLPAAKVGKEYRVRRIDLEEWYERHLKTQHA